jgi:hypothetical protein
MKPSYKTKWDRKPSAKTRKYKGVSYWKAKCWKLFSEIVRAKGCKNGYGNCVTCGVRKHFSELQAGHFIPGRHNSVLFEWDNVHPQCMKCNVFLHGNLLAYRDYMVKMYGEKTIEALREQDQKHVQFKTYQLEALYEELKDIKKSL